MALIATGGEWEDDDDDNDDDSVFELISEDINIGDPPSVIYTSHNVIDIVIDDDTSVAAREREMSQIPVSRGIRVCEKLIVEEGTHKYSLINCFGSRGFGRFPSPRADFVVHAVLADGVGELNAEIVIQRLEDDEVVHRRRGVIRMTDQLRETRLKMQLQAFSFPIPGTYQVALRLNDKPIDQTTLTIYLRGPQP